MKNEFSIEGKKILVTGAYGGIGRVIFKAFCDKGAQVIGVDIVTKEKFDEEVGSRAGGKYIEGSVANRENVVSFVSEAAQQFGDHIDGLVNCAAIAIESKAELVSKDDWDKVIAVNLSGLFWCCQEVGKVMIKNGKGGKIVNFSSRCGLIGYPDYISYNVSKAGVISITKTLAVEWARYNIQINALAPGFLRTEMTRYIWDNEERLQELLQRIPAKRIADPEEIVATVLYFCSDASNYVTGVVLPFDGGMLIS